jgi:hypothetical protein
MPAPALLEFIKATLPYRYDVIDVEPLELTIRIGALPPLALRDLSALEFGAWLAGGGRFGVAILALLSVLQPLLELGESITDTLAQGLH